MRQVLPLFRPVTHNLPSRHGQQLLGHVGGRRRRILGFRVRRRGWPPGIPYAELELLDPAIDQPVARLGRGPDEPD